MSRGSASSRAARSTSCSSLAWPAPRPTARCGSTAWWWPSRASGWGSGSSGRKRIVEEALCAEAERLNTRRDPTQLRDWQAHLRFVADAALPRGDLGAANLCHALAEHLYQTGDYTGARGYHEHALAIRQAVLGSEHPATARSLTQLGKVLLFYGDVAHARPYLEQALAIQQSQLGDHNDTATTLNHLGFLMQVPAPFS